MNILKRLDPKLIYTVYFTVISMLLLPLLSAVMILFTLPILLTQDISFLVQVLIFLLITGGLPLLVAFWVYKFSQTIKNQYLFFAIVFLFLAIMSYVNFTIGFALEDSTNALRLMVIGLVLGIYTSAVLTYFWRRLVLLNKSEDTKLLIVPLFLVLTIFILEWVSAAFFNQQIPINIYIAVGEFLKKFGVNIFYLDFHGFVGLFLSLIASASGLLMLSLRKGR